MSPNANPHSDNLIERLRAVVHGSQRLAMAEIALSSFTSLCHTESASAGWWINPANGESLIPMLRSPNEGERMWAQALICQKLLLIVSEVIEAMEGLRSGKMDDKLPHRPMIEVELADAFIRLGDLCDALGLDVAGAAVEKIAFNRTRADHKIENRLASGGKKF